MSRWKEINLHPDEPETEHSGKNWRYNGEIILSMALEFSRVGPRFQISRILTDETGVRLLVDDYDKEVGIERVRTKGSFVDDPFWYGYKPNHVRGFCRQYHLPEPEGYAKAWRIMHFGRRP